MKNKSRSCPACGKKTDFQDSITGCVEICSGCSKPPADCACSESKKTFVVTKSPAPAASPMKTSISSVSIDAKRAVISNKGRLEFWTVTERESKGRETIFWMQHFHVGGMSLSDSRFETHMAAYITADKKLGDPKELAGQMIGLDWYDLKLDPAKKDVPAVFSKATLYAMTLGPKCTVMHLGIKPDAFLEGIQNRSIDPYTGKRKNK